MKIFLKKNFFKILFTLFLTVPVITFSAGIVPDCGTAYSCNFCDLLQLINNVMKYFVFLAIPISTIVFSMIGWDLIVEGNKASARADANKKMISLMKGLFFILAPWIIVNTIISGLLSQNFFNVLSGNVKCERIPLQNMVTPTAPIVVTPRKTSDITSSNTTELLKANNISVTSKGNCSIQAIKTCTSFEGIQPTTIAGVIDLAQGCRAGGVNCQVTITGGTETGHTDAHSLGLKVDISDNDPNFNNFMNNLISGTKAESASVGDKYSNIKYGDKTYTIIKEGTHWDVLVK